MPTKSNAFSYAFPVILGLAEMGGLEASLWECLRPPWWRRMHNVPKFQSLKVSKFEIQSSNASPFQNSEISNWQLPNFQTNMFD